MFGLADTPESLLQEGGRPKRGLTEANNFRGFAFFFHRGTLGYLTSYFACVVGSLLIVTLCQFRKGYNPVP